MEILIVVVVVACIALALIPRFIAVRNRRELPPEPVAPRRPSPLAPTGPEAEAAGEPTDGTGIAVAEPPARIGDRIGKTRERLSGAFRSLRNRSTLDNTVWDELEEALLSADVGVGTTTDLLDGLRAKVADGAIEGPDALLEELKVDVEARLVADRSLARSADGTTVWLFVGVNGVGKTTTIGKLAKREADEGRKVVLAAGDTFRAAAGEQLSVWAERADADIVQGQAGGDPSSVVFDAVQRAAARGADLVLADTAGRIHTKSNLMEELRKVRRVADRDPGDVTEVLLVLDATTGQNGLAQARQFTEAVEVTGVVLTKLDGSARGGIVVAIQDDLGIPVKLVGLGEKAEDLIEFEPHDFVEALFDGSDA
jgi:fused signal recognition particle receptor